MSDLHMESISDALLKPCSYRLYPLYFINEDSGNCEYRFKYLPFLCKQFIEHCLHWNNQTKSVIFHCMDPNLILLPWPSKMVHVWLFKSVVNETNRSFFVKKILALHSSCFGKYAWPRLWYQNYVPELSIISIISFCTWFLYIKSTILSR